MTAERFGKLPHTFIQYPFLDHSLWNVNCYGLPTSPVIWPF